MDPLVLARTEFGLTAALHFTFVTLTLGLALLVTLMQARSLVGGGEVYDRMTRFWGLLYVINYAVGIMTGLVMEFQFGLNWTGLTAFAGNVFGMPLAFETLLAFFAESTFLGMWIFGWDRLPRPVHFALIALVTLTAFLSAFWILAANAFLQHPVGYVERNGTLYLASLGTLLTNPNLWIAFGHVTFAALVTGGLLVAGISAYQFIRGTDQGDLFLRSLRIGLAAAVIGIVFVTVVGVVQFQFILDNQPMKVYLLEARRAVIEAQLVARYGPGDYVPPVFFVALGALTMLSLWLVMVLVILSGTVALVRDWLVRSARARWLLWVLLGAVPLPFLANVGGWIYRETGRQPWTVYGLLPTREAVAATGAGQLLASLVAFTGVLVFLAVVDCLLIARVARTGGAVPTFGLRADTEPAAALESLF